MGEPVEAVESWEDELVSEATKVFGDGVHCPVCGDTSNNAVINMLEYHYVLEGAAVCYPCAEKIANAFNRKHSGAWLTPWIFPDETEPQLSGRRRKSLSVSRRLKIFERDGFRCQGPDCGSQRDLTIDHVTPIAAGGGNEDGNLQTLCRPCNASKHARVDWKGRVQQ